MENENQDTRKKDCGCSDPDSGELKKSIDKYKDEYCKELFKLKGDVVKLEVRRKTLGSLIENKQCWFVWTERNYRIHRNLGFQTSAELIQTSESIKEGVKTYTTTNTGLANALKGIVKSISEVKTKAFELRDAARKLSDCRKDQCNCAQIIELTGEVPEGCKGEPPKERPNGCDTATIKRILHKLVHMPEHLYYDIRSIQNAAADVSGIQTFSNISIDPMQNALSEKIKKFDDYLQEVIKRGEGELATSIKELSKSRKDLAKTEVELYATRSDFEGLKKAVAFYCCQVCTCITKDKDDCEKRLEACEKEICDICGKVKDAACPNPKPPTNETAKQY